MARGRRADRPRREPAWPSAVPPGGPRDPDAGPPSHVRLQHGAASRIHHPCTRRRGGGDGPASHRGFHGRALRGGRGRLSLHWCGTPVDTHPRHWRNRRYPWAPSKAHQVGRDGVPCCRTAGTGSSTGTWASRPRVSWSTATWSSARRPEATTRHPTG